MTKENAHLYLPLVQAMAVGKTIQWKNDMGWGDIEGMTFFDNPDYYRIKPDPVFKVGDWVTITKSDRGWFSIMDHFDGKTVRIFRLLEGGDRILFKDDELWRFKYSHGHFRPATAAEIKKATEPEYEPFAFEDWEMFMGKVVRNKGNDTLRVITLCSDMSLDGSFYEYAFRNFEFTDGTPFGKLKM